MNDAANLCRLPWLPPPPADFRMQCKALLNRASLAGSGVDIMRLAGFQLNNAKAKKLSSVIQAGIDAKAKLAPLSQFKLGILSNATMDFIGDAIPAAAARHGVAVELVIPSFDQVIQEALNPKSLLRNNPCDGILIYVDHHWFRIDRPLLAEDEKEKTLTDALEQLRSVIAGLQNDGTAVSIILATVAVPPIELFGSFDRAMPGSLRRLIQALNERIIALAAQQGAMLLDIAALAERIGTENWFDARSWNEYKLPCAPLYTEDFADVLGRLLGAMRGKARKCLVLDLDNTLWGGIIGDDGLEGIQIGAGTPIGEAHLAIQKYALDLKKRGIVLAVCSKNNDETARLPFKNHPGMLMKESDVTIFQANWIEKSTNIEAIAKSLNIDLNALVFLDDNPSERAHVRAALPSVAVPELPSDPSQFVSRLASAGYFEAIAFSSDDTLRVQSYQANAKRLEVKAESKNLGDYLSSLEMTIKCRPFDAPGRSRIAQLINKSNQFNLTTQRYTEAEVAAFETDSQSMTMQCYLADKFGDMGMIGVIICKVTEQNPAGVWSIDTWLMSCRVLGRNVEQAMLHKIIEGAKKRHIMEIHAKYRPTEKNNMVREHYDQLGFILVHENIDGVREYKLVVDEYIEQDFYMSVLAESM